jgi:hypothetical protein
MDTIVYNLTDSHSMTRKASNISFRIEAARYANGVVSTGKWIVEALYFGRATIWTRQSAGDRKKQKQNDKESGRVHKDPPLPDQMNLPCQSERAQGLDAMAWLPSAGA